jgi:peptide/nickel transport system permease protein
MNEHTSGSDPSLVLTDDRWRTLKSLVVFAKRNRSFQFGTAIVLMWTALGLFAPFISGYSPTEPRPNDVLQPPSYLHLLGTDANGMDILSRMLFAPRVDLGIALAATALAFTVGIVVGGFTGYFGGRGGAFSYASNVIMRVVDVSLAFPVFVIALALVAILGQNVTNVILAVFFVGTPVFIWLTRSQVLSVRERTFVEAARCSGNTELRIAFRHVLPNSLAAAITQGSVIMGFSILVTAGLSFVGAGVRIPTPEWGLMISEGASTVVTGRWWPALFPGIALLSAVFGFSLLGDGLRAYLDPRQR